MIKKLAIPERLKRIICMAYIVEQRFENPSVNRLIPAGFPCIVIHIHDSLCELGNYAGCHGFTMMPQTYLCGIFTNPIVLRSSYIHALNIVLHPWVMGSLFPQQMIQKNTVTDLDKDKSYSEFRPLLLETFLENSSKAEKNLVSLFERLVAGERKGHNPAAKNMEHIKHYVRFILSHPNCRLVDFNSEKELHLGYRTLTKHFAECTGISLGQFMKVKREMRATRIMIESQGEEIAHLSLLCGYESKGHFYRFCRRMFDKPPRNAADGMDTSIKEVIDLHEVKR